MPFPRPAPSPAAAPCGPQTHRVLPHAASAPQIILVQCGSGACSRERQWLRQTGHCCLAHFWQSTCSRSVPSFLAPIREGRAKAAAASSRRCSDSAAQICSSETSSLPFSLHTYEHIIRYQRMVFSRSLYSIHIVICSRYAHLDCFVMWIADSDAAVDAVANALMGQPIVICHFVQCRTLPRSQRRRKEQLHAAQNFRLMHRLEVSAFNHSDQCMWRNSAAHSHLQAPSCALESSCIGVNGNILVRSLCQSVRCSYTSLVKKSLCIQCAAHTCTHRPAAGRKIYSYCCIE